MGSFNYVPDEMLVSWKSNIEESIERESVLSLVIR